MLTKYQLNKIFKEACNGYGFETLPDRKGRVCEGCYQEIKRPAHAYTQDYKTVLCKTCVARLYNPEG